MPALEARVQELVDAGDTASREVERLQKSLVQACNHVKPRAARRIAAAEAQAREERERRSELEMRLTETDRKLAEEAAARVSAADDFDCANEDVQRLTGESAEAEARLAELLAAMAEEQRRTADLEGTLEHERGSASEALRARVESEKDLEGARAKLSVWRTSARRSRSERPSPRTCPGASARRVFCSKRGCRSLFTLSMRPAARPSRS